MNRRFSSKRAVLTALVLGIFAALFIAELGLRLYSHYGFSSFVFREFDHVKGTRLIPNSRGIHRWCWDGYVEVNRYGMRERDLPLSKPNGTIRIGVFGDSVIEAVHVRPHQTATILIESMLNSLHRERPIEVLNFSVASFSTVQEFLQYKTIGKGFDLDVVLVVSIPNDIVANVRPGDSRAGSFYFAPYLRRSGAGFEFVPPTRPSLAQRTTAYVSRFSNLAFFTSKTYYKVLKPRFNMDADNRSYWNLYNMDNSRSRLAWDGFEYILEQFRKETESDGVQLAITFIAMEDLPWKYTPPLESEYSSHFVKNAMTLNIQEFGNQYDVPTHSIGNAITRYIQQHGLQSPYLSFPCDPHYNAEGQKVIAESLAAFLETRVLNRLDNDTELTADSIPRELVPHTQ